MSMATYLMLKLSTRWPEYIAPMDAYTKKTCLWTGGGFVMPTKAAVDKGQWVQHTAPKARR